MANSDIRQFLRDCLIRYNPDADLSEGSRLDTDVVQPILQRIGLDPFDSDIATFVRERTRQAFPNLAITEVDEMTDLLIDPMRVLIEPLTREVKLIKLRSSLRNADSLSDDEIDSLLANFFLGRRSGGFAVGVVRMYFATPQSISITQTNPALTRSGRRFIPTRSQAITADTMLLNPEGSEYYFDANYTAENRGDEYNVEPGEIVSIANLPTATRVKNLRRFRGGAPKEASREYTSRAQSSIGDKTLAVNRGIVSTLNESFPAIRRMFSVGFRDPEMKRDIIKGGSLGPIPDPDVFGNFYGTGTIIDDLNADTVSPILDAPTGNFVSRLGAAGSEPDGWFITIAYGSVVKDLQVMEVLSSTQVVLSEEIPVGSTPLWMLRERRLTLSDIPGGITLPDTAAGTLEIRKDEVHIGGKTDVYIAGETEAATAQITSLSDENPVAKGASAQTQGTTPGSENYVILTDGILAGITRGMSLVMEEGVDAGSYRILGISGPTAPATVHIDTALTGAQGSLSWKVVDEIDVELTDPKDLKIEGDDLVTAAGNKTITTTGATNFIDANVQEGDVVEVFDEDYGGDFTVEEVSAVSLVVTPAPPRTFGAVAYRVFRRSEAIDPPLVRVKGMELLDSSGAPSGTKIPYRDPILAVSNGFANEGSGYVFEGLVSLGLITIPVASGGTYAAGGLSFEWASYDPDRIWAGPDGSGVLVFTGPLNRTAAQIAADINADAALSVLGITAEVITRNGFDYVGIVASQHVKFLSGTALAPLGFAHGHSNAAVRGKDTPLTDAGVRSGDVIEVSEGNNAGVRGRIVRGPEALTTGDLATVGTGPTGPEDLSGNTGLYYNTVFRPDTDVRVLIGRPSVGTARVYFIDPTSVEFDHNATVLTAAAGGRTLDYRPDPENTRTLLPAPPLTDLPSTGTTSGTDNALTDTDSNFLLLGINEGDLVDVLYIPIDGTAAMTSPGNVVFVSAGAFINNRLKLRVGTSPFITIDFPFSMPRQDVVDFINAQVGEDIASLNSGVLRLQSSERLEIDPTSSVITAATNPLLLAGAPRNNEHPDRGTYIVTLVEENTLWFSSMMTALATASQADTAYRVRRHVQRVSSTEMNQNQDVSGLRYADVELMSYGPGDGYNIAAGVELSVTGHRSDGYRLITDNAVTSYSRAEVLYAEISRTILLPGSSDDPSEYVQLSQQNVQVSYDRSQLVDEVQSFCDSDYQRVVVEEILVKHLLPHYVSLLWSYSGGSSEPDMVRAFEKLLDEVEPNEQLEVTDLTDVLRRRGATSVFTPDTASSTGRSAPVFIVVYHDEERRVRGMVVRDFVTTVRTQRYIADNIRLQRISVGGIR